MALSGDVLARKLSLFDATMIVVSGIIGAGIFFTPAVVAQTVRTPFLISAVWAAGGLVALAGAFVFAELSTVLPRAGGQYAFFREAFHPLLGFLYGWALLLIIYAGGTAAVAMACAEYSARLAGIPPALVRPLAVGIVLLLVGFHSLGIKPGALLLNVITAGKMLALAALIVLAFLLAGKAGVSAEPLLPAGPGAARLVSTFFAGLVPALFAYGGWQTVSYVAEELRDPLRDLPRAILAGVACVIAVYLGANFAMLRVLSASGLAATSTPAADAAALVAGPWGARAMGALIVASTFGFLNHALMTAPRVYYAMAADGLFFRAVARVHPRTRAPVAAIVTQGALACAFALTNSYARLLGYVVFADWLFFALAGVALIVLRRKLPGAARPHPVPFYPFTPLVFALFGFIIVLNTFVTDTGNALVGTAILAAGVPAYYLWRAFQDHPHLGA